MTCNSVIESFLSKQPQSKHGGEVESGRSDHLRNITFLSGPFFWTVSARHVEPPAGSPLAASRPRSRRSKQPSLQSRCSLDPCPKRSQRSTAGPPGRHPDASDHNPSSIVRVDEGIILNKNEHVTRVDSLIHRLAWPILRTLKSESY